jgi:hypothetical protein
MDKSTLIALGGVVIAALSLVVAFYLRGGHNETALWINSSRTCDFVK